MASTTKGFMGTSEYNGSKTVVFGNDPNPRANFSFGPRKAGLFLDAVEVHGIDAALAMLSTVAGRLPVPSSVKADSEPADGCTVATATVPPVKAEPFTVVSGMISVAKPTDPTADMSRADMIDYLVGVTDLSISELSICGDAEIRSYAREFMDCIRKPEVPLPPVKPFMDDSVERAELIQRLKDAGTKGNLASWKIETLRAKVSALPAAKPVPTQTTPPVAPEPEAPASNPAPVLTVEMRTQALRYNVEGSRVVDVAVVGMLILALLADGRTFEVRGDSSRPRFFKTDAKFPAPTKPASTDPLAYSGWRMPSDGKTTIIHTEIIKGKTYVLFSTGETKLAYVVNGQTRYRKTSVVISKAPLTPVPSPTPAVKPASHAAKTAMVPFVVTVAKGQNGLTYAIMSDNTCQVM